MAADVSLSTGNSSYLSGSIKWSGLASGVDFASVVDQLIEIEKTGITRLEIWKSTWEAKITSIQGLNSRMVSLRDFVKGFDSFSEFYSRSSSSSNSSVVSVSNTSSASPGSHNIVVGEDISGRTISRSVPPADAPAPDRYVWTGMAAPDSLVITVGGQTPITVNLAAGTDYTIDDIAAMIDAADTNDILEPVQVFNDKVRDISGSDYTYQRLIITAKAAYGGSANEITVSDPTTLNLDENSVDAAYEKNWLGTSTPTSGGTYTGTTNKTFTFRAANTGVIGTNDVTIQWADDEGNSGSFVVTAAATDYEIFQGVTVQFSGGIILESDSFTIDAYTPTLQAAQDKGLAQVEQRVHEGFIDLITPITTSDATFVYRYEGVETTVKIKADAKLQDLVNAINNDPNNRGVTASIINDGQSTSTSYHLVLTGKHTGAEHSIRFVSDTLTDLDLSEGKFTTAQKAANSMIKVNGYPNETSVYIQRSTNTVGDILNGVVLDLHDSGAATVTVGNDVAAIRENIELLVSSVNFVLDYIRQETKYDSTTGESGAMLGNYSYEIVRNMINSILSEAIPGLDSDEDAYVHLAQIGIKTDPDQDGRWVIMSSTLNDALNNNLEAVARLFVKDDDRGSLGVCERLREKFQTLTDSQDGIGNVLLKNYRGIIKDIDSKITREERRIELVKERLEQKFANLETLLAQLEGQSSYLENQLKNLPSITIGKKS